MGICASCLGLNRHPSHDIEETDALLDDSSPVHYGGIGEDEITQPDEEELRRERETLDQITAEASDNMIDVSHPSSSDLTHHFGHTNHDRQATAASQDEPEDAEEAAWLQSIQFAGLDSVTEVRGLQSGALVMDISQLRQQEAPSSTKKVAKSAIR